MKPTIATYTIRRKHLELEDLVVKVERWGRRDHDLFVNGNSWGEGMDWIQVMECLWTLAYQGVKNYTINRVEGALHSRLRDAEEAAK